MIKKFEVPSQITNSSNKKIFTKNWEPQKDVFHTSDRLTLLQDEYNSFSAELTTKSNQIKTAKIFAEETYGFENESMQQKFV